MDGLAGRDFPVHLVEKEKVAFATQRQALNALVFFYKDVEVEREVVTVHAGKGDKDRETIIPNCIKETLGAEIKAQRSEGRRAGSVGGGMKYCLTLGSAWTAGFAAPGEFLFPDAEGAFDFLGFAGGAEFPDERAVFRKKR